MASAVTYLANVTKSVKYATVDVIKDLNPVLVDTVEANSDVIKKTYSTIKNFKKVTEKSAKYIKDSEISHIVSTGLKNSLEDLKSGKFYNKERITKYENEQLSNYMNDDDGFEFSFDNNSDSFDMDAGDSFGMDDLAQTVDDVGEKASNAVSQVIIKGAEYNAKVNSTIASKLIAQNTTMVTTIHHDIGSVNTNLANLLKFDTDVMQTHIQNSTQFFSRQQEQMSEQTAIMKEILDLTKKHYGDMENNNSQSNKVGIGDLLSYEGSLNIEQYIKYIKQNIKAKDTGMGDMIKMMMDMGFGKTAAASPLSYLLTGGIKFLTPKVLKESMEEFNATFGSIAGNLILKATSKQGDLGILGQIGDILGMSESYKRKYDTGKYKKGPTSWTGEDHKALTEVIPTYLSKIYNSLSGKGESRFDYDTGKFVSENEIRDRWESKYLRDTMQSHGELSDVVLREIRQKYSGNSDRQNELIDTLNRIFQDDLKHSRVFNLRNKNATAEYYGLKGGAKDQANLEELKRIMNDIPQIQKLLLGQANSMINTISQNNREMSRLQGDGHSVFNSLFNDSFEEVASSNNTKKSKAAPVFDLSATNGYLLAINKEVAYIRELLSAGQIRLRRSNRKSKANSMVSLDQYSFYNDIKDNNEKPSDTKPITEPDYTQAKQNEAEQRSEEIDNQKAKKTFLDRMVEANSLSDKFAVIMGGVTELAKSPAKIVAGMLQKADDRVYKMLFGTGENDDKSFMNRLKDSLNTWLDTTLKLTKDKFNEWSTKLKEKFSQEKRDEFFGKVKKMFHIDTKGRSIKDFMFGENDDGWGTNIVNMFKKGFKSQADDVVDSFKSAKNDITGSGLGNIFSGTLNATGKEKEKRNKAADEAARDLYDSLKDIPNAASGMRRVPKTGVVAVSEGEMIVPPDMNPYNIAKRAKNEQKAIDEFKSKFGDGLKINKFADGGEVTEDDVDNAPKSKIEELLEKHSGDVEWYAEKIKNPIFKRQIEKIKKTPRGKELLKPFKKNIYKLKSKKEKYTADDYEEGEESLKIRMGNEIKSIFKGSKEALSENVAYENIMKGISNASNDKQFKAVTKDLKGNFKNYLPHIAAGGVTGAVISKVLGLVGGPLVGAASGIAIGLLKNSTKLQNWLFGEEIVDEEGNVVGRKGGKFSKELSTTITKYAPDMGKGAIVGGITSLLPFIPGGPITGILVGSALGYAKNNEEIQKTLFGPNTMLGQMGQIIKKKLPRLGLGALTGAIAGPFGLVPNLVVGSVLGMATDTEKFKDFLFGKKGFDDKRRGGVAGLIKEQFDRTGEFIKGLIKDFKTEFIEKDIIRPLKHFFKPLKQQGVNILKVFTRDAKEHIWAPIGTYLKRVLFSTESIIGKILFGTKKGRERKGTGRAGLVGVAKNFALLPLNIAGGAGNLLRRHQLNTGGAGDLTAEERLAERERLFLNNTGQSRIKGALNKMTGGLLFKNGKHEMSNWYTTDQALAGMNAEQARNVAMAAHTAAMGNAKAVNKQVYAVFGKKPIDKLKAHFAAGELTIEQYNRIVNAVKAGNSDVISGYINDSNMSDENKKIAIEQLTSAADKIKEEKSLVDKDFNAYRKAAIKTLQGLGIDVASAKKSTLNKIYDYATKQADFRFADEEEEIRKNLDPIETMHDTVKDGFTNLFERLDTIGIKIKNPEDERGHFKPNKIGDSVSNDESDIPNDDNNTWQNTLNDLYNDTEDESSKNELDFIGIIKSKLKNLFGAKKKNANSSRLENMLNDNTDEDSLDTDNTEAIDTVAELSKKKNKKKSKSIIEKINASGEVMRYYRDRRGKLTLMTSDSDTNSAIKSQEEQQNTQTGILSKISQMSDNIKSAFIGSDDDNSSKSSGSFLSKMVSLLFGSGIAKKVLAGAASLAGLGILGTKIKIKATSSDGTILYDDDGNPIYVEKTIGEVVTGALKKVWLGSDGTGNTSGLWYGIKTVVPEMWNWMEPKLEAAADVVFGTWIPKGVELLVQYLPSIIASGIKGAKSWFTKSKSTTDANKQSNLTESYTMTSGGSLLSGTSSSTSNTSSSDSIVSSAFGSSSSSSGTSTSNSSSTSTNISSAATSALSSIANTSGSASTTATSTNSNISSSATSALNSISNTTSTGTSYSSSGSSSSTTAVSSSISPSLEAEMRSSKAFKYANTNAQNKAINQLAGIWNEETTLGKTVGEVLNDDSTVLATIIDEDGNSVDITGENIIQYSSYMDGLSKQLLGVDLALSESDRDEYTESTGNRINKSILTKMKNGLFGVVMRGGVKNSKSLGVAIKLTSKVADYAGKFPIIGKTAKAYINATTTLPLKTTRAASNAVYNIRTQGLTEGIKTTASEAKSAITKSSKSATKTSSKIATKAVEETTEATTKAAAKAVSSADNVIDATEAFTSTATKTATKAASKTDNVIDATTKFTSTAEKIATKADDAISAATTVAKATDAVADTAKATSKTTKAVAEAAEAVTESATNGKLAKVMTGIKNFFQNNKVVQKLSNALSSLGDSSIVQKLTKKSLDDIMGEIAEKICTKFLKQSPEVAAKVGAKVAADATVILMVADAVVSFGLGLYKADMILGIKNPNALFKVIAGILNALNEVFLFGIIDTSDIFTFFWNLLVKVFPSLENSDLEKQREELTEEVEEYNKENGTNYTEEEYLKKDKLLYKLQDKVWNSRAMAGVKGLTEGLVSGVGSLATDTIINPAKTAWSTAKNLLSGDITLGEAVSTSAKTTASVIASPFKAAGKVLSSTWSGIKTLFTGKKSSSTDTEDTEDTSVDTSTSSAIQSYASDVNSTIASNADTTQYITDDNGNIVGYDADGDGVADSMYIAQGDSDSSTYTTDSTGLPSQMITNSNQELIQETMSDINSSIPTLTVALKNKVANLFGVNSSNSASNKTSLTDMAQSAVYDSARNNEASKFFTNTNKMWTKVNDSVSEMQDTLPDKISSAAVSAANMAQTTVLGGDVSQVVTAGTNTESESLEDAIANVQSDNTAKSLGLSLISNTKNFATALSKSIKKLWSKITGKGSGLSDDANISETEDPTVSNFISQKSSKYSSMTFGTSGNTSTVKDAGCAPATAAMAINSNPMSSGRLTMYDAVKDASPYKQDDGGVSADYFAQEFANNGMTPTYLTPANKGYKDIIISQLRSGNTIVLMGTDPGNNTKKKSPFGPTGHYVVAVGVSSDGKTIYINDPEADTAKIPYDTDTVLNSIELAIIPTINKTNASSSILKRVKKALQSFKGMANDTDSTTASSSSSTTGGWLSGTTTKVTSISDAINAFDELAQYYGLSSSSSSSSSDTTSTASTSTATTSTSNSVSTSSISGNVSSNSEIAAKQKALVAKMKSVEGTLKYQQNNEQYPGSRNPDEGGGDCSSTIQWAYKNVTGIDPGSWTGAMRTDDDTYTVATSLSDESKLQLGDILLKDGHVEMYAGNGKMIGHGGGSDGKTLGPTTKDLGSSPPYDLVRRLNEFKGAGSGIFVSQNDSKYRLKTIGTETVGDSGCAPAAATMAANLAASQTSSRLDMNDAIKFAQSYASSSGVSADYFVKQFEAKGLSSLVISGSNISDRIMGILQGKSGAIVLLGRNPDNTSKKKSPFGSVSHYIVATGISEDGQTIYVNDPEAKEENIPYPVSSVLPYVTVAIMPKAKGNSKLDAASKKLSKLLSKMHGKGKYSATDPQYIVWNFLRTNGCSEHCTAGIMGNIQQESSFQLDADDGTNADGTGAHGLFQWQGSRFTALKQFAADSNSTWDNLAVQLNYFLTELDGLDYWLKAKNTAYSTVDELKNSNNYIDATTAFELAFERAGTPMMEKRIQYAKEFLEEFTDTAVDENAISLASSYKNGTSSSTSTSSSDSDDSISSWYSSLENTLSGSSSITDVYTAFDKLAQYYGLSSTSSSSSSSTSSSSSSSTSSSSSLKSSSVSASQYLSQFSSWKGAITGGSTHHAIVDEYNKHLDSDESEASYDDKWNQIAASAADSALGDKSVARTSNLFSAINYYKNNSLWHDRDESGFTPQPGDQIYYSWSRDGVPDHVGAVVNSPDSDGNISTIEGDYGNILQNATRDSNSTQIMGYGRPAWGSGKGSGLLKKINRFKENPKPISSFKLDLSGKGTSTPVYSDGTDDISSTTTTKRELSTPTLSRSYSSTNNSSSTSTTETKSGTQNSNDTTLKLIDLVIQLLGKVVDNTSSIKDIASLLTALLKSDESNSTTATSTSYTNTIDSQARALLLKSMKDSNTENTSLEKLIANVQAIIQQ